jgi:hypothetical protein
MLVWATPEDADVDDAKVVKWANPASWITVQQLAEQRQALPDLAYRRFLANQWTAREGHWLPPGAWQACVGEPKFTPGEKVWVGVDVGGERSASAVVWLNEALHIGCAVYHGEGGVLDCLDRVRDLAGEYQVVEVVCDPWRFGQAAGARTRGALHGPVPSEHDQDDPGFAKTPRGDHVEAPDPAGRPGARPARGECDRPALAAGMENRQPGKELHIDAIVALAMALDSAETQPEPVRLLGWL